MVIKQILISLLNPIKYRSRENKHPWFKGWRENQASVGEEGRECREDEVIGGSTFLMLQGGRPHNSSLHPQGQCGDIHTVCAQ